MRYIVLIQQATVAFRLYLATFCASICYGVPSATWQDFEASRSAGTEPILPDFSYTGYHYSEIPIPTPAHKIFKVDDFGAVPNDGQSDRDAIQAAIDAASHHGSGIVQFPEGRFHLNALDDVSMPIKISSSDIILRGSGEGLGGTELYMEKHLDPEDPEKMYSTPFILKIASPNNKESYITQVIKSATRETFTLTVASTEGLKVGQRITLYLKSTDAVGEALAPYRAPAPWTRLQTDGIVVKERHIIDSIQGNQITFKEPLHTTVNAAHGWEIRSYNVIEEIGIEDIHFVGNWKGDFVHHRSAIDDGGWSGIKMENVANSWIRRCTFTDWNYCIALRSSAGVSVLQVTMQGNKGHYSAHSRGGYGTLFGLIRDTTASFHGPSVGYQSVGTVYWNYKYEASTTWDAHSGLPYATLLDCVEGGIMYGRSGGPLVGLPNHWRHFVMWNFKHTGPTQTDYDFWRDEDKKRDRFLRPIIVGLHGHRTSFNEASLQLIESHGIAVSPRSLFESQLSLRIGELPDFLQVMKKQWESQK